MRTIRLLRACEGLPVLSGAVLAVALVAAGCANAGSAAAGVPRPARATPAAGAPSSASPTPGPTPTARPWPLVLPVPTPPPAAPQTRTLPSAHTSVFHAEMTDLWAGIVTGRYRLAMPAFFPLSAYEQVKAIADPAADWHGRLVYEFRLDIAAAHAYLGRGARHARLLRVIVPKSESAWIDPGVCYNGVGYWHVAGPRLVYREHGQVRSIGIASLISWRGLWYVVHFGAVIRTTSGGVVDTPAIGPGVPGPPGGC